VLHIVHAGHTLGAIDDRFGLSVMQSSARTVWRTRLTCRAGADSRGSPGLARVESHAASRDDIRVAKTCLGTGLDPLQTRNMYERVFGLPRTQPSPPP
jgi:hypothetical protein